MGAASEGTYGVDDYADGVPYCAGDFGGPVTEDLGVNARGVTIVVIGKSGEIEWGQCTYVGTTRLATKPRPTITPQKLPNAPSGL